MLKFFFRQSRRSSACHADDGGGSEDWIRDPLAHPAIEAMDERQLGDLPFCTFADGREHFADALPACRS